MVSSAPKIAVIGGGTGSFTLLQDLKKITPHVTAIVNMSDDGGSTGVLRDELGVLPPGDVRQCLVALSNIPEVRELFSYRFGEGMLAGHSLGNVIISGLELQYGGDFKKAIAVASELLDVTGKVVPVTLQHHTLLLRLKDKIMKGQYEIERAEINDASARIDHEPSVSINPEAHSAILQADLVVIAPGNVYCSLLPALAVDGMREALTQTDAKTVMVANLVNKPHQTDQWQVVDYVQTLETYLGEGAIDYVLYNNQEPPKALLAKYTHEGEHLLDTVPHALDTIHAKTIGAPLVSSSITPRHSNDTLIARTFIRHDAQRVCQELVKLLNRH